MKEPIPYAEHPRLIQMMLDIGRVEQQITKLRDSISRLESRKYRITSVLTGMPHGGQKADINDINGDIEILSAQIETLAQQRARMLCELDMDPDGETLRPVEYAALKFRYIYKYRYEDIAEILDVSIATINRDIKSGYRRLKMIGK